MVRPSAHHKDFSASYYFYFEPRVQRVTIAKANLFASSATVKSETLLGRRALLSLKTTGTSRGSFAPEDMSWVHLVCDSLQLNKDPDLYSCSGGGDDWFGNFVLTDDEGSLEQVHAVVVGEIKKSEGALIIR